MIHNFDREDHPFETAVQMYGSRQEEPERNLSNQTGARAHKIRKVSKVRRVNRK